MNEYRVNYRGPFILFEQNDNVVTTNVCASSMSWNQSFLNLCTPPPYHTMLLLLSCHYNDHITTM